MGYIIDDRPHNPLNMSKEALREEIERLEIKNYGRAVSRWPEEEREMYIIAEKPHKFGEPGQGCIAWRTFGGKEAAELVMRLTKEYPKVSIMTVSDPAVYGEYAPYDLAETQIEFERKIRKMVNRGIKRKKSDIANL